MKVKDMMSTDVLTINLDTNINEAFRIMKEKKVSGFRSWTGESW